MEEQKNRVEVNVAGITLTLVSEEDKAYVEGLAARLDRRVSELSLRHPRCTKTEALVFAAIEALDAAVKLKGKLSEVKDHAE